MRTRTSPDTPVKQALQRGAAASSTAGSKAPAAKRKPKQVKPKLQQHVAVVSPFFKVKEEVREDERQTSHYFNADTTASAATTTAPTSAGSAWHDLHMAPEELRLQVTLMSGMLFRWVELPQAPQPTTSGPLPPTSTTTTKTYIGMAGEYAVELTETDTATYYRVLGGGVGGSKKQSEAEVAAVVKRELLSLFSATASISRAVMDPKFAEADQAFRDRAALYRGLRVVHCDLFESIVSFLGSANNSIKRNAKMLQALCRMFPENMRVHPPSPAPGSGKRGGQGGGGGRGGGRPKAKAAEVEKEGSTEFNAATVAAFSDTSGMVNAAASVAAETKRSSAPHQHPAPITAGEMTPALMLASAMHSFPTIEQLSSLTEEQYWELGWGYRAPRMTKMLGQLVELGGTTWLEKVQTLPYVESRAELEKLCGVGRKVADCICLFVRPPMTQR